jgi:hypothetical protein
MTELPDNKHIRAMRRRLTEAELAHRLGRIRKFIAVTPGWTKYFWIDMENYVLHVIIPQEWKQNEKTATR